MYNGGDRGSKPPAFPPFFPDFFPLVLSSTAKYQEMCCNFPYLRPDLSYSASSNFLRLFSLIPILCPPPLRQGGLPTPCPRGFTFPPVLPDDLLSSLTVKQSVSILHDFWNMAACLSLWKMDSAFFKESGFLWSNLKAHMAVFLCYLPHLASSRQYCWSTKQSTLGNFFAFVSIQIEIVFFA